MRRERKPGSLVTLTLVVEQKAVRALDAVGALVGLNRQEVLLRGLLLACQEVQQMRLQQMRSSVVVEEVGPENMDRVLSLMLGEPFPA